MTDEDRVRLAVQKGNRMLGPIERQRCSRHGRRWELYRWTWPVGGSPEHGDVKIERSCGSCSEENFDAVD